MVDKHIRAAGLTGVRYGTLALLAELSTAFFIGSLSENIDKIIDISSLEVVCAEIVVKCGIR